MANTLVSTVPADVLALLVARTSAGKVMTKSSHHMIYIYIYIFIYIYKHVHQVLTLVEDICISAYYVIMILDNDSLLFSMQEFPYENENISSIMSHLNIFNELLYQFWIFYFEKILGYSHIAVFVVSYGTSNTIVLGIP